MRTIGKHLIVFAAFFVTIGSLGEAETYRELIAPCALALMGGAFIFIADGEEIKSKDTNNTNNNQNQTG